MEVLYCSMDMLTKVRIKHSVLNKTILIQYNYSNSESIHLKLSHYKSDVQQ